MDIDQGHLYAPGIDPYYRMECLKKKYTNL